jgi:hypothetical protein
MNMYPPLSCLKYWPELMNKCGVFPAWRSLFYDLRKFNPHLSIHVGATNIIPIHVSMRSTSIRIAIFQSTDHYRPPPTHWIAYVFPHIPKAFITQWANLTRPELINIEALEVQLTLTLYPLARNTTHSLSTMIEAAVTIEDDGLRFASISNGRLLLSIEELI